MDQELRELFDLRWKDRDRVLGQEFLRVKEEMNARGLLNSSMTIQGAHKVMTKEFESDRQLITDTIIDFVGKTQRITSISAFQDIAQAELASRKVAIENQFSSGFKNIMSGLQNPSMVAPFVNLSEVFPLAQKRLSIELGNAISAYNSSFGSNLTDQLRNRFLNRPIIAVAVLSVVGASFILGVLKMLGFVNFGH
ncbi:hypothetical protein GCM10009113_00040 [Marinobacter szutsaonensis]